MKFGKPVDVNRTTNRNSFLGEIWKLPPGFIKLVSLEMLEINLQMGRAIWIPLAEEGTHEAIQNPDPR
jgi:hypothetical protein